MSMPVLRRSSGSVSSRRPDPPGNSVVNSRSKFSLTSANAPSKMETISRSTARITRVSSRRLALTSSSCSWRKRWRSCSASCSSSASGLIGPISRSSRSRSRARPASVVPSGTCGATASSADSGSTSYSVRRRSTAVSRRSRVSASSISARWARSRTSVSSRSSSAALGAQRVELLGRRARRFRLAPPLLAEASVELAGARREAVELHRRAPRTRCRARAGSPAGAPPAPARRGRGQRAGRRRPPAAR